MTLATRVLRRALTPIVKTGSLTLIAPSGEPLVFGDGTGTQVVVRVHDERALWAMLLDPDLKTGELYTDGRLTLERGDVLDFLSLILRHGDEVRPGPIGRAIDRLRTATQLWRQRNDPDRAQRNVAHHYDLGDALYRLFLDPDWQYSCAYFEHPGQSLADAQLAKKRHVAAKLRLEPAHRVLDIGCGWGGLALYLAGPAGVASVLGITLSEEQVARARDRAAALGMDGRVSFDLVDYRAVTGRFDRVVSVGMFEHVGLGNYRTFFETCRDRLADDGLMLLHTIGCSDEPSVTNPWITRYIFPGGHLPSLSDITKEVERSGLIVTDIEVLRLHYAETLKAWRANFRARRAEAEALFDERFCRMWDYYLAMSEAAFRYEKVVVFQLQIARRQDAAPLTRNYIGQAEARLREREIEFAAAEATPPRLRAYLRRIQRRRRTISPRTGSAFTGA